MRGKLAFGAATAALLMFVSPAFAQSADQPGDASTQARLSSSADGEIGAAGDIDWYRLSVEGGQRYSFTLDGVAGADGQALDPMLGIYDAEGNQLAMNDDSGESLNSALSYAPSASGDIFVEARAYSDEATGRYHLAVTSSAVPPDAAGNDATTRARLTPGAPITGNIESQGDSDWYRLSARRGQRYHITLSGTEQDGVNDTLLRVVDRNGAELASNDDSEGSLNSALDFVPESSGDVFVVAAAYADAYTGGYLLSASTSTAPTDNLSSDARTRGRLNVDDNVTSSLDFPADRDWFRMRLIAGSSYRFTLDGAGDNPLGDPMLVIHGANGDDLATDDDGGEGLNSYLEFTAPTTGNYYIESRGFSEDATGGYTLSARAGDIPGDSSTDIALSADGDYRDGTLAPAGDHDWYKVELAAGQGIRVGLTSREGAPALSDPFLVLHGADGAEVLRDDDGGEGLNAWFEYQAATAGAYFIEVRGFTDDAAGDYSLELTAGEVGASADSAESITPNGDGRTSTISSNDDVDWFAVEMVEGRPYRFYLDGAGDDALADPYLALFDAEGHQVAADDDGGSGLNAALTYTSVTGGTYYAAASSYGSASSGRYQLRIVDTDVPGTPNTDETLDATGDDDRVSRIEIPGDLDAYHVELEAGHRYVIDVARHGDNALGDPYISILNAEGQSVTADDDGGDGRNARVRFTPTESGSYFIQASGLGGSTGEYQVRIVRQ